MVAPVTVAFLSTAPAAVASGLHLTRTRTMGNKVIFERFAHAPGRLSATDAVVSHDAPPEGLCEGVESAWIDLTSHATAMPKRVGASVTWNPSSLNHLRGAACASQSSSASRGVNTRDHLRKYLQNQILSSLRLGLKSIIIRQKIEIVTLKKGARVQNVRCEHRGRDAILRIDRRSAPVPVEVIPVNAITVDGHLLRGSKRAARLVICQVSRKQHLQKNHTCQRFKLRITSYKITYG